MDICMLTWEFPPRIVGGIARHCYGLAKSLAHNGHGVHVVTLDFPGTPIYEEMDGIKVYRTAVEMGHPNFFTWALIFNHFMMKRVGDLSQRVDLDIVHIHDWLTAPVGISFKHYKSKPMIVTIHSTEHGRSGLHNPESYTIDGMEWWATYEANKVIVASGSMKRECEHFHLPSEKVEVIPNGIDSAKYQLPVDRWWVRSRYGLQPNEKLVLCVGRLVPQKGIEYLIRAAPLIHSRYPEAKLLIVGDGWQRDQLERLAQSVGYRWKITFTGFLPDQEVIALMNSADVLVVPSIYEPFGIVALEGMAAGVPVVASQIGGLAEVINHDHTGVFVYPRSPKSIAWGIDHVLSNPEHGKWLTRNAREIIQKFYSWEIIAMKTVKVYEEVVGC